MEQFLKRIQTADHATKKQILIITSAVVMLIIILVWLFYFNNLVASRATENEISSTPQETQPSFWGTMERGSAVLYRSIMGGIEWIGGALRAPREYIVKPTK